MVAIVSPAVRLRNRRILAAQQFHVVDQPRLTKEYRQRDQPAAGHHIHRLKRLSIHQRKVVDATQGRALGEVLAGDFEQLIRTRHAAWLLALS